MTQTTAGRRKPARPAADAAIPTREQRVARERAARSGEPRGLRAAAEPPRSPEPARAPVGGARAGAVADPLRPHGRVPIHVLPRCRATHGERPRRQPTHGAAHARTGDRVAIASYLGSGSAFDRAVGEFARSYADQNERDHRALVDAIGTGRIEAESGL
jgi:hypothetical protein